MARDRIFSVGGTERAPSTIFPLSPAPCILDPCPPRLPCRNRNTSSFSYTQGMDVVGYYATYGHSARIKMFHCMRADLTGTDCPYELVVVPKEVIRGDYYTVTAAGVVQVSGEG